MFKSGISVYQARESVEAYLIEHEIPFLGTGTATRLSNEKYYIPIKLLSGETFCEVDIVSGEIEPSQMIKRFERSF